MTQRLDSDMDGDKKITQNTTCAKILKVIIGLSQIILQHEKGWNSYKGQA